MNILIGIAILLTLMLSDAHTQGQQSLTEVLILLAWVTLASLIPPLIAAIQVLGVDRNVHDLSDKRSNHISRQLIVHATVWFVSTIVIATFLQWPRLIRFDWGFANWILVDELLILTPLLLSLITSWWIQSEYQTKYAKNDERFQNRRQFVMIRCRVYLSIVLVPILIMILIRDLWPFISTVSPALASVAAVCAIIFVLCFMPYLLSLMWENRSIRDGEGRDELLQHCHQHHLTVKDIRIWDTGNQIVNALVAGIFPRFRVLMLSDLLLNSFPRHELRAVLRHEAGHVRMGHLPIRIGFILLPALAMIAIDMDTNQSMKTWFQQSLIPIDDTMSIHVLLGILFIGYILAITAWLSKNMEFEADLYAVGAFSTVGTEVESVATTYTSAQAMADALLRFAEQNPEQYAHRSLTHPSLLDRIELIKSYVKDPHQALEFRRRFIALQIFIAVTIVLATATIILV